VSTTTILIIKRLGIVIYVSNTYVILYKYVYKYLNIIKKKCTYSDVWNEKVPTSVEQRGEK